MKAVVLVGGEGTRLRPLTYTTPKPLLPIANQAFLERQLDWLGSHDIDEVVLSLGYLPDAFERHFPDGRYGDLRIRYAVETEPLGTAGAIRFAADGIDERFVVCNGDVLTGLDLGAMVAFHDEREAEATICLSEVEDPSAFGVVPTRGDGRVVAFVEKPPRGQAPSNWINAGTYVLEPAFLDRIPPRLHVSVERETFPRMLERAGALFGFPSDAYWLDIGTPSKYLQAHLDVLVGELGFPPAPGARERSPGVWEVGRAEIDDGVAIEPPVLLGPGVRVAAGTTLTRAVLGAGAVVEAGCELDRAVVHAGAHLGYACRLTSSVVGPGAVLKPEVRLSDETLIGAGATVAPGARISGGRFPVEGQEGPRWPNDAPS